MKTNPRKEIIKKWEKSNILEGLNEIKDIKKFKLFEPNLTQKINVITPNN